MTPAWVASLCTMSGLLWVDKHRPTLLDELDYHERLSTRLQKVVRRLPRVPYWLAVGPNG